MSEPAPTTTIATTSARVATAALTVTCMSWGVSFVFIKDLDRLVQSRVGEPFWAAPLWIATVRFLLAGLLLLALPFVHRALSRPLARDALYLAVPSILGYVLQAAGMRGVDAGTNAFLTSMYTPLTPLIAWLLLRQTPAPRVLAAIVVAMSGVALLSLAEQGKAQVEGHFARYASLVLLGSVCWALQILGIDRWARKHPSGAFSCALFLWIAAGGAVCLGAALLLADPASLGAPATVAPAVAAATGGEARAAFVQRMLELVVDPAALRPLAGLVLLSTLLAMTLMNRFQPCLDPSRAALLYTLEPAFAGAFAFVSHGEAFGGPKLAGCAVLLLANLLVEAPGLLALVRGPGAGATKAA